MTDTTSDFEKLTPLQRALFALKEMKAKLEVLQRAANEPIAIVGMSCRFPSAAADPEAYWRLLRDGVDAITEVPAERWDIREYYDPDPDAPGRMCTRHGGFIEGVDLFDPQFFGIAPREAVSIDPQQRLLLEVSWEALEHAGIAPDRLSGSRTGVFLGICGSDYASLRLKIGDARRADAHSGSGAAMSIASGRLSYLLGLQGPSLSVDTACSASLVAVHLACQSLRKRESDLALAAGVNVILLPEVTVGFSRAHMMAPDGRCKTFDAAADGYVRGEGCGVVVLKRLSQALAERDPILAVIRGSAVNQDGRSGGLTAPNGRAQEAVIREALASAGLEPAAIDYVEAHGTGTSLGDPIEVRALGAVLGPGHSKNVPLLVGSVKTNIGHLEAAAGVASLIKVTLALQNGEIPPSLHFQTPNPYVPWDELPVAVVTTRRPWPRRGIRRTAGLSSFGFSGTNAHVILEEPPPSEISAAQGPERPLHLLVLSGRTEQALRELARRYRDRFASLEPGMLSDACHMAGAGRAHLEHRAAVVARSLDEAGDRLASLALGQPAPGIVIGQVVPGTKPRIAFLFTGQGSQYVGMGRELYETQPTFRRALERCAEVLGPALEKPLLEVMFGGDGGALDETGFTQPALFALEWSLTELWRSWGVAPSLVLGHSVGEYAAACVAGVFSLEEGLRLVAERARLMQALARDGAMVSVAAGEERVREAIGAYDSEVSVAAVNGPESVVISGRRGAVERVAARLESAGVRSKALVVSHAFHSPLMEPMLGEFGRVTSGVRYEAPRMGLVSNVTGRVVKAGEVDAAYWVRHVREAVRFSAGIGTLQEQDCQVLVEVGPNPVLVGMGRACVPQGYGVWLPTLRKGREDWQQVLASLGELYVRGVEVDWPGFDRDYARRKVALPTYPFERKRYWHEDATLTRASRVVGGRVEHPLLGRRLRSAVVEKQYEVVLGPESPTYLKDQAVWGSVVFPVAGFLEMGLAVAARESGAAAVIEDVGFEQPLFLPEGKAPTVQCILDTTGGFQVFSLADAVEERWQRHATGRVGGRGTGEPEPPPGNAPAEAGLDAARARCQQPQEVSAYYERFRALGVEYGPAFRGIEAVWSGDGEAVGCLSLPEAAGDTTGYRLHPALLDAGFQVLGAAYGRRDSGDDVYMPTHLKRLTVRGEVGRRAWAHAVVQAEPGKAASLSGEIRLFDEAGRLVAEVEGLELRRVTRAALERVQPKPYLEWLYEVSWEEKALDGAAPLAGERVVVLRGQDALGGQLSQRLRDRGAIVAEITDGEDAKLEALLREAGGDAPCRVVALGAVEALEADATPLLQTARTVCGGTLRLVQALARRQAPARLYLVTRGAQAVGEAPKVSPAQAALWGLGRTVALEHPELACVRVDLEPGRAQDAEALAAELGAGDGEDQVAYRGGTRFVARLVRPGHRAPALSAEIRADATYLVTGGLGSRGLVVAQWLVAEGAQHLVLVGRRGPGEAAQTAIAEWARRGVQVQVRQADVAHAEEVQALVAGLGAQPPLRGVIHAAGVLDDGVLLQQSWERFARVLAPKALGAWHLHRATAGMDLDFFVLFSSVAAVLGSAGQGNYAAANAYLDGLAWYRRGRGLPALSLNWGPWGEVGMAAQLAEREQSRRAAGGVALIPPALGVQALGYALASGAPQWTVLPIDWPGFLGRFPVGEEPPLFRRMASDATRAAVPPTREATGAMRRRLAEAPASEREALLLVYVREQVARVLGLDPSHPPSDKTGFIDMGMDSLMAVELRNRLQEDLVIALPSNVVFEYATIGTLSAHLGIEALLRATSGGDTLQPGSSHGGDAQPIDAERAQVMLGKMAELTDAQVDQLLAEMVRQRRSPK